MRVFRGRLVHCKVPERVEVLEDQLIGFEEKDLGRVSELLFVMLTGATYYCTLVQSVIIALQ